MRDAECSCCVVAGIGVHPRIDLAGQSWDCCRARSRRESLPRNQRKGRIAAGDIALWPDQHSGGSVRVEHLIVAERRGQTAREKFTAVPFFRSQHEDVLINYVGHSENWDEFAVEGDIPGKGCVLRFKYRGRTLASIFRGRESLQAELTMEREQERRSA